MNADYIKQGLKEAADMVDAARAAMNAARKYSKEWNRAADDLEFWTNKRAFFSVTCRTQVSA